MLNNTMVLKRSSTVDSRYNYISIIIKSILIACTIVIFNCGKTDEIFVEKPIEIISDGTSKSGSILITSGQGGKIITTSSTGIKYTLTIPENAVNKDDTVEIIMTPINEVKNLPQGISFIAAVEFKPEGLTFWKSAQLSMEFPESIGPPTNIVTFSFFEDYSLHQFSFEKLEC